MELESNYKYEILMLFANYMYCFFNTVWHLKLLYMKFGIKMGNILPSILCLQGAFLVPSPSGILS